ncbi:succinylglutamate desuccinylase/aspartoacylase family protein [Chryseobacterium pennipullorum]|uniref:Succinylglutamate desuccinylase n=1 Tax=Chryseobacterium pennipullorum TaxID=2258963 RepID=A0A3D9AYN4_9FLAO|nr:succinylglutamate desuccinylase/aspartoacylase family protein [Chryseobacterium pennipullorum]REC46434.1 succinylglutamate desuccinylase [Chryseobacterium pennipullorum]
MKSILKTVLLLSGIMGPLADAQKISRMLEQKGPFRKDTVFTMTAGSKETRLPVILIKGKEKGPVFSIVAGIHGYEYPPIVAVQEITKEIDASFVYGTLIIVPVANVEAFHRRTPFINPSDHKNLNNAFPGSPNGTATDQIADFMTREIIARSTVFLDIHGGDANEDLLPFVCYYDRKDTPQNTQMAHELSVQSEIKHIVSYPYNLTPQEPAKYAFKQAVQHGITALSIEAGKLGTVQKENVDLIKKAVYNMLEHSGVYVRRKSKLKSPKAAIYLNRQDYIRVPETGIFYSDLKSGDPVKKKQLLGYITDEFGNKIQDIVSDSEGTILYKVGTPPVNKGETLFCIGYTQN